MKVNLPEGWDIILDVAKLAPNLGKVVVDSRTILELDNEIARLASIIDQNTQENKPKMYYEETNIEGILHCRSSPKGEWRPVSLESLNKRLQMQIESQKEQKAVIAIVKLLLDNDYQQAYELLAILAGKNL